MDWDKVKGLQAAGWRTADAADLQPKPKAESTAAHRGLGGTAPLTTNRL